MFRVFISSSEWETQDKTTKPSCNYARKLTLSSFSLFVRRWDRTFDTFLIIDRTCGLGSTKTTIPNYHPLTADALSMLITISTVIGHGFKTPLLRFHTRDSQVCLLINHLLQLVVANYHHRCVSKRVLMMSTITDHHLRISLCEKIVLPAIVSLQMNRYISNRNGINWHDYLQKKIQWTTFKTDKGPVPCKLPLKSNWSQRNWPTINWSRSVTQFYRSILGPCPTE